MTEPKEHPLARELAAYEAMQDELTKHHFGKFVVVHDGQLIDAFDTFDNAAREAVKRFGKRPYLIRQVGKDPSMPMPASVAYRPIHAGY